MPQTNNMRGHDYAMPSALAYALTRGSTWALFCTTCRREIAVDVIELVARYDVESFDSDAMLARAKCRDCGGRLKHTGGFQVRALKNTGHMPRLITADGSDWRRPVWRTICA